MKLNLLLHQSYIRIRIIGIILILIGLIFFIDPNSLNVKIGFASILVGILIIFINTKKADVQQISDVQIKGNIETIKKIIRELQLKGNAIFLQKTGKLTEERIIIPPNNTDIIQIPNINNDNVFLARRGKKNLGISVPPSGLKLLNEVEKEEKFENIQIEQIDKKLQIFVGLDLIKSLSFKRFQNSWVLEMEKPVFCPGDKNLCKQYPCPTCSAILTAITRASDTPELKLWIKDAKYNGRKVTFYLSFIKKLKRDD